MNWTERIESASSRVLAEAGVDFGVAPRDSSGRCRAYGPHDPTDGIAPSDPPEWLPSSQREMWSLARRAATSDPTDPLWQEVVGGLATHPDWPWNYAIDAVREWIASGDADSRGAARGRAESKLKLVRVRGVERAVRAHSIGG